MICSKSSPKNDESMSRRFGCFFAVLPTQPSISPEQLLSAWETVNSSPQFLTTHNRVGELVHPQLSYPLRFLEVSGILTLESDDDSSADAVCEEMVQRLLQQQYNVVGNAEVLLVLVDTPIPVLPTPLPVVEEDWAKGIFEQYGVVTLNNIGVQPDDLVELETHVMTEFERLYGALLERTDKKKHFKEIMARDDNRFDFRLDRCGEGSNDEGAIWNRLGKRDGGWLLFVQSLLGKDFILLRCGCVLSLPGTEVQYWHSDGVHVGDSSTLDDSDAAAPVHALCVFCPLIDLNEETGYTEFWAGSHKYSKLLAKKGEQALPGGTKGILNKGNFLVYDYRTIHRGMPNTSARARPVCYFLYTRAGFEFVEDQNFTEQSVFGDC